MVVGVVVVVVVVIVVVVVVVVDVVSADLTLDRGIFFWIRYWKGGLGGNRRKLKNLVQSITSV